MDYLTVILLGAIWGSFANVCIYRLPNNQGVISGRSFCPKCKKKIQWFDNIPILSFAILMGKCRNCKQPIDIQYLIVEGLSVISFATVYYFFGFTITSLLLILLSVFLIIILFIDLKHFIIPNVLTFPLMVIGFLKSFGPNLDTMIFPNYINSLIGGVFGYLVIWSIIYFYKQVRKKEGMGLGDAKLMSALGFWFGWVCIPFTIFIASILALIMVMPSLINKTKKMSSEIPFGPYIIIGAIVYLSFSDEIKNLIL